MFVVSLWGEDSLPPHNSLGERGYAENDIQTLQGR
jgi:hypothetical protein